MSADMLTKNGKFRLQEDAIKKFRKLPVTIQAQIVKNACQDIGWKTRFSIPLPSWANANNKTFNIDMEDFYKDNIKAYGWDACVSNYGFYYNIYNGNSEITRTTVENGITRPNRVRTLDKVNSHVVNAHELRNYLNKHLKAKLPKILIDDYPEHII